MPANARVFVVVGIILFMAGCWAGMSSASSDGESYCVVTPETASLHPGFTAGQFVEEPIDGCLEGEHLVCGHFDESGDTRTFVSEDCDD
jgi:hypothetical protein